MDFRNYLSVQTEAMEKPDNHVQEELRGHFHETDKDVSDKSSTVNACFLKRFH